MLAELIICGLLTLHLLCVNVCSAGPLVCVWLQWRCRGTTPVADPTAVRMAAYCLVLLVVGAGLGLAVGGLDYMRGNTGLVEVLPQYEYKIWWGLAELACYAGWMLGYWLWLKLSPPVLSWQRWVHGSLAVLASTNLLYHFPALLTLMAKSADGQIDIESTVISSAQFRSLAYSPDVLAHTLHFAVASLAVSGVLLVAFSLGIGADVRLRVLGSRLALAATLAQIPGGVWLLVAIPATAQSRLTGGDLASTGLFVLSILVAFSLMQNLATLAISENGEKEARRAVALMLLTVLLMTATLRRVRTPGGLLPPSVQADLQQPVHASRLRGHGQLLAQQCCGNHQSEQQRRS